MPSLRRAVLIYNPRSGKQQGSSLLPALVARLREGGFDVRPLTTSGPGTATGLARAVAAEAQAEAVFALGGDGTLREVAAGLLGSPLPLGILPAGTANVLSIALGLPGNALGAAGAMGRCRVDTFDVGLANGVPFLMMASCGIDAAVMSEQNPFLKRHLGKAAIVLSGFGHMVTYDYPELELRVDGRAERVSFFSVCNIPFFGGRFRLAPDADWHDGELDLVLFRGRGNLATLGFAASVLLGRHDRRKDVEVRRVRQIEVLGPLRQGLQVDGDVLPMDPPVNIEVAAERLRVLVPPERVRG